MIRIILLIMFISTVSVSHSMSSEPNADSISVTSADFTFSPNSWNIKAGKEITLTMTNTGKEEHEWVLLKDGTTVTIPFGEDDENKVFWEIEARPGEVKQETFTAPHEPGTYDIVCGKPQHLEQGMKATLLVK